MAADNRFSHLHSPRLSQQSQRTDDTVVTQIWDPQTSPNASKRHTFAGQTPAQQPSDDFCITEEQPAPARQEWDFIPKTTNAPKSGARSHAGEPLSPNAPNFSRPFAPRKPESYFPLDAQYQDERPSNDSSGSSTQRSASSSGSKDDAIPRRKRKNDRYSSKSMYSDTGSTSDSRTTTMTSASSFPSSIVSPGEEPTRPKPKDQSTQTEDLTRLNTLKSLDLEMSKKQPHTLEPIQEASRTPSQQDLRASPQSPTPEPLEHASNHLPTISTFPNDQSSRSSTDAAPPPIRVDHALSRPPVASAFSDYSSRPSTDTANSSFLPTEQTSRRNSPPLQRSHTDYSPFRPPEMPPARIDPRPRSAIVEPTLNVDALQLDEHSAITTLPQFSPNRPASIMSAAEPPTVQDNRMFGGRGQPQSSRLKTAWSDKSAGSRSATSDKTGNRSAEQRPPMRARRWSASSYDTSELSQKDREKLEKKGINPALWCEMNAARGGKGGGGKKGGRFKMPPLAGSTFL